MRIVDAHLHLGQPGVFFAPETGLGALLAHLDRLGIDAAVCTDQRSVTCGCADGLTGLQSVFEESHGRVHYLGVFHPERAQVCLRAMAGALTCPGFAGVKIHPTFHRMPADAPGYAPVWRFAAEHGLPILAHSWSVSEHNPAQQLSVPTRFEAYVREFPGVRLVLGHTGGRGREQADAIRMAREYPSVYVDIAGDVFCAGLMERLAPIADKVLFGSDYPWLDIRANLTRVLFAAIPATAKERILGGTAIEVYRMDGAPC